MRRLLVLALAVLAVGLAGCGGDDAERFSDRIRTDARELRDRAERASERLARRVRDVLEDLEQAVPRAAPGLQPPSTRGTVTSATVDAFLTRTIEDVDRYWTRTLSAAGLEEPRVRYVWVPEGRAVLTGCRVVADDHAAFYCPADDTIYLARRLAAELWQGINDDFPGQRAGYGRAIGDFGLAYIVAHEYAHNVQFELGFYELSPTLGSKPFELQADCMSGLWGNSVYQAGRLQPGDVQEAIGTALAAGDFDYANASHHGTPDERRTAWLLGFRSGEPQRCREYVPAV